MRVALVTAALLAVAVAAAAERTRLRLLSTNGISVYASCGPHQRPLLETTGLRAAQGDRLNRRTADGALLGVSLSRTGCGVEAAWIALLGAPSGAWLDIGATDIYTVGRLSLVCRRSIVTSSFRLDSGTATAYVSVESTASRRQKVLQPGQALRGPPISVEQAANARFELTVSPGGEAGGTTAHIVEVARPRCRVDVRVQMTAFRNG